MLRNERVAYLALCVLLLVDALLMLSDVHVATVAQAASLGVDRCVVVAAALVLAVLGAFGRRAPSPYPLPHTGEDKRSGAELRLDIGGGRAFAIGLACGLMFFARTLGSALADPTSIAWLLNGDWAQHYSGWAMFRDAPWHWPPGLLPEIWYPVGTSVTYTDSLPLLAFLFKPFSAWLPVPFQYIGAWFLINAMLQGGFGALLAARVSRRPCAILLGAALFVFAPVFINRIAHDTLTAHWLILASLWLYFRPLPTQTIRVIAWPWWLISAIAALVHPYLASMTLAIQAAFWWKCVTFDQSSTRRRAWLAFAISIAAILCMWWIDGASIIPRDDASGRIAYGKYSLNLLGFVNPVGFSRWLPAWPTLQGQYEGFSYLGVGMLALLGILTIDAVLRGLRPHWPQQWRALTIVAVVLLAFAVSTVVAVGSLVIVDLPIKDAVLGAFRSSGRFVWIAYYALMLALIWTTLRRFRNASATMLLALTLVLQMADLFPAHRSIAALRLGKPDASPVLLDDPRWNALANGRHHLTMLPPTACGVQAGPYLPFLLFAADHRMTFNSGYLARWNLAATNAYCAALKEQLAAATWSADDLYVVGADWKAAFNRQQPPPHCETLDGYDVCVVEPASRR